MTKALVRGWLEGREPDAEASAPERPDVVPRAAGPASLAQELGVAAGRPDGTIGGYEPATRQEVVVMLMRAVNWLRHPTPPH